MAAREFGVPGVFSTHSATRRIPDGAWVTVDGAQGTVEWGEEGAYLKGTLEMEEVTNETTPSTPKDKASLLARIQAEWSALMQTIGKLAPEQMTTPGEGGWSVKDNLAHLAAWEQFMLNYHLQGQPPYEAMQLDQATFERLDEDGLNAVLYERNKDRSSEGILDALRRSHEQALAVLEQMPFADLMKPRYSDDPERRPVINWVIGNTYEHYEEHRRAIEAIAGA